MSHLARCLPAALVLLAFVALPASAQKKYRLRVSPTFRVGDVASNTSRDTQSFSVFGLEDSKLRHVRTETIASSVRTEVLKTGRGGEPALLRRCIVESRKLIKFTAAGQAPVKQNVELKNVWFLARRDGPAFRPDTSTLRLPEGTRLTGDQITFLREAFLQGRFELPTIPDAAEKLLPEQPIAAGETWTPSRAALERFAEERGLPAGPNTKFSRVSFVLAAVTDGLAHLTGRMRVSSKYQDTPVTFDLVLSRKLDLTTGHWVGFTQQVKSTVVESTGKTTVTAKSRSGTTLTPGDGAVSAEPGGLRPPAQPIDLCENKKYGFRIRLPIGYVEHAEGVNKKTVASFRHARGGALFVTVMESKKPSSLDFYASLGFATLKDPRQRKVEVHEETAVTLPRGNKGELLVLSEPKTQKHTQVLVVIGAKDAEKDHVFMVFAITRMDKTDLIESVRKAMLTFEVAPPTPSTRGKK